MTLVKMTVNLSTYSRIRYFNLASRRLFADRPNLTNDESNSHKDIIGPPDPISNLRPIIFTKSVNETNLEKKYRETREATQKWNQTFWLRHNTSFIAERKQYQDMLKANGKTNVTADEMSVFYKKFLDENWKTHFNYNLTWYRKNFKLLILELLVRLSKLKFK